MMGINIHRILKTKTMEYPLKISLKIFQKEKAKIEEFAIDKIVDYRFRKSTPHRYVKKGAYLNRFMSYDYEGEDDT